MSVTIFRTKKLVFYVDQKIRNGITKKTIINKYNIPIEDKRSKITFGDKKPSKKRTSKLSLNQRKSILQNIPSVPMTPKKDPHKKQEIMMFHDQEIEDEIVLHKATSSQNITSQNTTPQNIITHAFKLQQPQLQISNTLLQYVPPKLSQTPGKLKHLKFGHTSQYENIEEKWEPFICKVEKRLFSNRTNKYVLQVTDGDGDSYNVHVASQLFELIQKNLINVGDWIEVNHYSATNMSYDKPRLVIFVNFEKTNNPV